VGTVAAHRGFVELRAHWGQDLIDWRCCRRLLSRIGFQESHAGPDSDRDGKEAGEKRGSEQEEKKEEKRDLWEWVGRG